MSKLDKSIAEVAYILDSLMALRNIYNTGCCNDCDNCNDCKYLPKPGQMVRFNCPFHESIKYKIADDMYICGTTEKECCFCSPCCEHRRHIVK